LNSVFYLPGQFVKIRAEANLPLPWLKEEGQGDLIDMVCAKMLKRQDTLIHLQRFAQLPNQIRIVTGGANFDRRIHVSHVVRSIGQPNRFDCV
jgi:hypothetical protein